MGVFVTLFGSERKTKRNPISFVPQKYTPNMKHQNLTTYVKFQGGFLYVPLPSLGPALVSVHPFRWGLIFFFPQATERISRGTEEGPLSDWKCNFELGCKACCFDRGRRNGMTPRFNKNKIQLVVVFFGSPQIRFVPNTRTRSLPYPLHPTPTFFRVSCRPSTNRGGIYSGKPGFLKNKKRRGEPQQVQEKYASGQIEPTGLKGALNRRFLASSEAPDWIGVVDANKMDRRATKSTWTRKISLNKGLLP